MRDINTNQLYHAEFSKLGATGVPTFLIGNEVIVGFDKNRIEALLDYRVIPCPACSTRMRVPKGKGKIRITCAGCRHRFERTT